MRKQRCDEACLSRIHFFDWSADAKVQTQKSLEATAVIIAFVVGSLPSASGYRDYWELATTFGAEVRSTKPPET
jgi:hypothetical protein